jgi:hypothetical protein
MTLLSYSEALDAAREVAAAETPSLEVLAATPQGDSTATELIINIRGCHVEPCRLVLAFDRNASRTAFKEAVGRSLRLHLGA